MRRNAFLALAIVSLIVFGACRVTIVEPSDDRRSDIRDPDRDERRPSKRSDPKDCLTGEGGRFGADGAGGANGHGGGRGGHGGAGGSAVVGGSATAGGHGGAGAAAVASAGGETATAVSGHDGVDGADGVSVFSSTGDFGVEGSGNVITEQRPVSGFSEVLFRGSGRLLIDRTGTESLSIEAEDNLLPYLVSEVRGNRLVLGVRSGCGIQATRQIIFRLTVSQLNAIRASGSGQVDAKGLNSDNLRVDQSGSFEIIASGTAARQEVEVSGSGSYDGRNLDSNQAMVDVSGSGDVVVKVSDRLDAEVSGSGSVEYIGDPTVTQDVSGSGLVQKRG